MEESDLAYFKTLLESWLRDLLARAGESVVDLKESMENLPDPLDRAIFESNRDFNLRIRDRESVLIKKIRESLEDIEAGEYGICVRCDQEISIGRLRARPVARLCIKCKTMMERAEKLTI